MACGTLALCAHVLAATTGLPPAPAAPLDPGAAGPPGASVSADAVEISEPMRAAVVLAKAAGGGLGLVGSVLALDDSATPDEVAIIQAVPVSKLKLGEIVMLVRDDCQQPAGCLMARRIVEKRGADLATKRYGRPQVEPGKDADASMIGRIAYAVDLKTGRIRDLRTDDTKTVTLVEALRRESKKWRTVGEHVRPNRYRV